MTKTYGSMKQALKYVIAVAVGCLICYFICKIPSPPPECCNPNDICELPAPDTVNAEFDGQILNVNWPPVANAASYEVDVYDVTEFFEPVLLNQSTGDTSISLQSGEFEPGHIYEIFVAGVCDNCNTSVMAASTSTCFIIIDDICKLSGGCSLAPCNCNSTVTPADFGNRKTFPLHPTNWEMFRIEFNCGAARSAFVFETKMVGTHRCVETKSDPEVDHCGDPDLIDNPPRVITTQGGCKIYSHNNPVYEVEIRLNEVEIRNYAASCVIDVKQCKCPPPG